MTMNKNPVPEKLSDAILAHYEHHSACWEESGLKQSVYCRQHDLQFHTFSYVRGKLLKSKKIEPYQAKAKPPFVPVTAKKVSDTARQENRTQLVQCRLHLSHGYILEWPSTLAVAELKTLFLALGISG